MQDQSSHFVNLLILLGLRLVNARIRPRVGKEAKDVLREKLTGAKVRPVDLAKAIGVKKSQASMMLSGQRGISTWHLNAIAELLHIPVAELFTERDLVGQQADQESDPLRGSDASASAALSRLQQQHDAFTAATADIANRLLAMLDEEGVEVEFRPDHARAGTRKPGSRPRARKAG